MRIQHLLLMACVGLLTACTTRTQAEPVPGARAEVSSVTELATQRLEPGECGLFLWSISRENKFIFFSKAGSGMAQFIFDGSKLDLIQTGLSGEIFGQFLTMMTYASEVPPLSVNLEIEPGDAISGGQKVSAGRIIVTDIEGWETVLPIVGTRACVAGL